MRKRYVVGDGGFLTDRDGTILGRVCGITLEIPVESPLYSGGAALSPGGGGAAVEVKTSNGRTSGEIAQTLRLDGGAGETFAEEDLSDAAKARRVHEHFVAAAEPRVKKLGPGQNRLLLKAVRESDVALCCQAIDGMLTYAKRKGGETTLSRVFATRPGGSTLADQISWWASQAPGADSGGFIPSDEAAEITAAKRSVRQYAPFRRNEHAQRLTKEASDKLMAHGVATTVEYRDTPGNGERCLIGFSDE